MNICLVFILKQNGALEGIWLGPKDLHLLAEKDHRTWFDKWFKSDDE